MIENITESRTAFSNDERGLLALEASWEIEHLASLVMELSEGDNDALPFRGLGARIKQLNSVIMSAIGDDGETNDELYYRIFLKGQPKAA